MNFFSPNFEPNVEATVLLIKELNANVTNATVNETLQNHPDFPSLLSVSDSLDHWGIENVAATVETSKLDELPTPFLAMIRETKDSMLVLVKEVSENTVRYRRSLNQRNDTINPRSEFLTKWTGVALLAEKNESSGEPNFSTKRKREIIAAFTKVCLVGALIVLGVIGFFEFTAQQNAEYYSIAYVSLFLTKLIGIFVSGLLIWAVIDQNNNALKKVCSGINNGDCNSVLNSRYSKLLGISWVDIGLCYFVGGLICLLTTTGSTSGIMVLSGLGLLAVPYTFFSIYLQWRVIRKWCTLCLAVQGLLILEFVIAVILINALPFDLPDSHAVLSICLSFVVPVLIWSLTKPFLSIYHENKLAARNLIRLKSNKEIFEAFLVTQKLIPQDPGDLGIILGNSESENVLVVISNPLCGPCAKIHPEIEKLLELNMNLRVQLLFTNGVGGGSDEGQSFVNFLMTIYDGGDHAATRKILDEWYESPVKDYTQFVKNYPYPLRLNQQAAAEAMENWCSSTGITETPTRFFNGRQLPEVFTILDLKYILATG